MYNLKDLKMYVTLAKTGFLLFEKFDFFIKNDGKSHINQGFQICHIYLEIYSCRDFGQVL